jgi:DNA-binding LacI/PurR family transcriptional regulator
VNTDREDLIRQAVRALAQSGRRKVGLINWGGTRLQPVPIKDRSLLDLFERTAAEFDLETKPEWILAVGDPGVPSAGWEAFQDLWRATREKPDGLVVTDDLLLPGVFDALRSCGVSVPDQLMLASHFNEGSPMPLPYPLIKIQFSPAEYARALADLLLAALRSEPVTANPVVLSHHVVLPESVTRLSSCGARGTARPTQTPSALGRAVSPLTADETT